MENEVIWVKVVVDLFDNEKIKLLENMPNGDSILVVWFKLLCLAGKLNSGGLFIIRGKPYDANMLSAATRVSRKKITAALRVFEEFGMIEMVDGVIVICGWERYQSTDELDRLKQRDDERAARRREATRRRVAKSRANKRGVNEPCDGVPGECSGDDCNAENSVTGCVTSVTGCVTSEPIEEEIKNIDNSLTHSNACACARVCENGGVENSDISFDDMEIEYGDKTAEELKKAVEDTEKFLKNRIKMNFFSEKTGKNKVLLSEAQLDALLEELSVDEFEKYAGIVQSCESRGKSYHKKTHFQAILDMARADRAADVNAGGQNNGKM